MEEIIQRAERVAETKSTVLITGETGTGKELVARAIHDRSAQRDMPLIKVNCAAIPESLLESELFGHVRGAFTGATTTKKGKFALADGGTIFLDEIGTMSLAAPVEAAARAAGAGVRAARGRTDRARRRARDRGHQPRPPADGGRGQVPGGSLLPAQRDPDRAARRCASGARTFRRSSSTSSASTRSGSAGGSSESTTACWRRCSSTTGPATCASWRTRSSAPSCSRPDPVITAQAISVLGAAAPQTTGLPSLKLRQNIEWVERETIRRALESARGVKKDAAELMGISQRALSYYLAKYRLD